MARDTVIRRLAHEPYGWRPTILHVSVRRYRCQECAHVWRQDMSQAADPRAKLSRAAVRWALTGLVVHHLTVARISQALGVSWNTANTAVLGEGQRLLINDPTRFDGVRVIGVDEHVWRHTPYGDKYVTVILDLTPIRERSGPSRLLDMVPGRSKQVFKTWLASRPDTWRSRIEIVAMDGFTGFKSAATEELPGARAVMDPFHVVHLAGNALDECRRRIQQELHHRRGRSTDPLYKARRVLHTRSCLLTLGQQYQILDLFSGDEHVALEVTWSAYQNIIDAYRAPDTDVGKALMEAEINTLTSTRVPRSLTELTTLGRTLKRRATDILAYFDHPHTSNGPTEAINGRSNTYAASPKDSSTTETTAYAASSTPADSNTSYTLKCEEPAFPGRTSPVPQQQSPISLHVVHYFVECALCSTFERCVAFVRACVSVAFRVVNFAGNRLPADYARFAVIGASIGVFQL